jgi:hypothetical protein
MLREAIESLLTPCPPWARRLGIRTESIALGARARRQRRAWAPHVAAARAFVEEAMGTVPAGGRAIVLGSGHLAEVPLDALAGHFAEVVLADAVHPLAVRHRLRRHPNVRLLTIDLTGVLAALDAALAAGRPLPPVAGAAPDLGRFDFAVSCNLLSQLPIAPLAAIEERAPAVGEAEREAYAKALIEAHVTWLRQLAGTATLFTDVEEILHDPRDGGETRSPTTWGVAMPPPDRRWTWNLAPHPEFDRHRDLTLAIEAWRDLNAHRHCGLFGLETGW